MSVSVGVERCRWLLCAGILLGIVFLLSFGLTSAGPIFGPLLLAISICLVGMIAVLALDLRLSKSVPPAFIEKFIDTVKKQKRKEAFDLARTDASFLARVLASGMARLPLGIENARAAALNTAESIQSRKAHLLACLALLGTLGVMIGYVGTVVRMIQMFMALGQSAQLSKTNVEIVIIHALAVTLLGIGISVPAIFFHTFFRNRLIRISNDSTRIADELLAQM